MSDKFNRGKWVFTSESVAEGHPDKVCDQISDSILDEILRQDPKARVACETAVTTGLVLIIGEITTECYVDIQGIARKKIAEIGYTKGKLGFDSETCAVLVAINSQSEDIKDGVDRSLELRKGDHDENSNLGAGDQGMVFGYANSDTKEKMPLALMLSHKLCRRLAQVRKTGILDYLRPDGKAQVSVEYFNENPVRVDTVVVSAQHDPDITQERIYNDIKKHVIDNVIPANMMDADTKIYINPSGRFVIGGPMGDSGVTGRKIIVDTYGGYARHGGGSFSGKDPTKMDRTAAYAARYAAKNIVSSGAALECEIQISYAIGKAEPVSINVNTYGTGKISDSKIEEIVNKVFDFRPASIIENFDLRKPIYSQLAAYGHFGREDLNLPWEKTDKIDLIRELGNF